jgi:peptidoglycan/xylan/chitin deacetylase (PgdA/CDA1 family)
VHTVSLIKTVVFVSLFVNAAAIAATPAAMAATPTNPPETRHPCNCVVFRLDDVIDWSLSNVNIAIMDYFLIEDKPLSVEIIVSNFGNDYPYGKVYNKTLEGYKAGLFEIGIHQWAKERYNAIDYSAQVYLLNESDDKLQKLFGARPTLFAPPQNEFDSDTIRAMANVGITTFSTTYHEERATSNPYKVSTAYDTGKALVHLSEVNGTKIYHVPTGISYLGLTKLGYSGENLTNELVRRAEDNIGKYGYSIIALHPTDFAIMDPSTGVHTNKVDPAKFKVLIHTADTLESKGYSFGKIKSVLP